MPNECPAPELPKLNQFFARLGAKLRGEVSFRLHKGMKRCKPHSRSGSRDKSQIIWCLFISVQFVERTPTQHPGAKKDLCCKNKFKPHLIVQDSIFLWTFLPPQSYALCVLCISMCTRLHLIIFGRPGFGLVQFTFWPRKRCGYWTCHRALQTLFPHFTFSKPHNHSPNEG